MLSPSACPKGSRVSKKCRCMRMRILMMHPLKMLNILPEIIPKFGKLGTSDTARRAFVTTSRLRAIDCNTQVQIAPVPATFYSLATTISDFVRFNGDQFVRGAGVKTLKLNGTYFAAHPEC